MNIGLSFSEEIGAISKEQQAIKNNLQKRKYCYVATIIYKDINAPEVIKLRNLINKFGRICYSLNNSI